MSGHTPGPWRTGSLISYNASTGEPEAFIYRLPPGHPEATAHNRICVRGSVSAMDCDADARLIAAAPVMYEALKEIAEGAGAYSRDPLEHAANCIDAMKAIARAAIAKAEGGSK